MVTWTGISNIYTRRHADNKLSNKFQGFFGYYCAASGVPKRVIATMNKMGACVSYDSVLSIQKAVARDVEVLIRHLIVNENRRFQISFDNLQITASTKFQMKHKVGHMQNNVLPYLLITDEVGQIPRSDIDRSAINSIKSHQLLPDKSTLDALEESAVFSAFKLLVKLYPKEMSGWKARNKQHVPSKALVNEVKTEGIRERQQLFSLPLLRLDEQKLEDVVKILERLGDIIGYDPEQMKDSLVLLKGDQMTIARVL